MKFRFKIQQYQSDAVNAIADVFRGQPYVERTKYTRDLGFRPKSAQPTFFDSGIGATLFEDEDIGFANNRIELSPLMLLDNIRNIQSIANIKESDTLSHTLGAVDLDVEMETGTGKTYVYIKSMFELNKRYGFSKFIVVVPSIAIREGVKKSFEMTQEHFMDSYGKKARFFIYNSKKLDEIEQFSSSSAINVMIINIQAFNTRGADARRIYEELDEFQSRRPIDVIAKNRPILILDEPQKMGGEATQESLKKFNPLFSMNFSATHRTVHNTVYVLDALDAFNKKLVKKIQVKGFTIKNLRGTNGYLYLQDIVLSPSKPPQAKIELEIKYPSGKLARETRILKVRDNLYQTSNEMEQYNGFVISEIDPFTNTVAFLNGEVIELQSKHKFDKTEFLKAKNLADEYNAIGAHVTSVKRKKDVLSPGKLFSLSKLQNVLGKKYKMSMAESLEIIQKLYEEGYLTYPRTNSEYLATAEKDKIRKIIENCKRIGYPLTFKDKKTIFDDSKIESHSALTPTYKIPDKSRLSEKEMQVYSTVFRRFVAVFCEQDSLVDKTEIKIEIPDREEFTLRGTVIVEKGWTKYDDYNAKDKLLPPLNRGDAVALAFSPVEKETSPPRHYTIETLNNYLKNPFKNEKAGENLDSIDSDLIDDTEDYRAIFEGLELGTEATRTGIIDNARQSEYIKLNKDVYSILPAGEYLIESLRHMQIRMDKYKTAEMGKALKRVYRGDCTIQDSVELAKAEIAEVFTPKTLPPEEDTEIGLCFQPIGTCPLCGGEVRRTRFGYGCGSYRENGCKFSVSQSICGRVIPISAVKQLLESGKTCKLKGFISRKSGKTFDASLRLEGGRAVFDFS